MSTAEARKLMASAITANGAVTRPMIAPPTPWPPIWAAETLTWSLELPSMSWSASRSDGR